MSNKALLVPGIVVISLNAPHIPLSPLRTLPCRGCCDSAAREKVEQVKECIWTHMCVAWGRPTVACGRPIRTCTHLRPSSSSSTSSPRACDVTCCHSQETFFFSPFHFIKEGEKREPLSMCCFLCLERLDNFFGRFVVALFFSITVISG